MLITTFNILLLIILFISIILFFRFTKTFKEAFEKILTSMIEHQKKIIINNNSFVKEVNNTINQLNKTCKDLNSIKTDSDKLEKTTSEIIAHVKILKEIVVSYKKLGIDVNKIDHQIKELSNKIVKK